MAQANRVSKNKTHEGGKALNRVDPIAQLSRTLMSCMLWEKTFYEDGLSVAQRIQDIIQNISVDREQEVFRLIVEAKNSGLRHAPLLATVAFSQRGSVLTRALVDSVIRRADELAEFMAIYEEMTGRNRPSSGVKKGLSDAFHKFDEYQFAKYARDKAWKLRDVMFISHPKATGPGEQELFAKIANNDLSTPDTWETALSAGADKRDTFEAMLREGRLGGLALLRNLRNMKEANVPRDVVRRGLDEMKVGRILPFRFVAAAKHAPEHADVLEEKLFERISQYNVLDKSVAILVDVSGSMGSELSSRSELQRIDAAATIASFMKEVARESRVYAFPSRSSYAWHGERGGKVSFELPSSYRGFALISHLKQYSGGYTPLGQAISEVAADAKPDLMVVITDEQAHDNVTMPQCPGYLINVASYEPAVDHGHWERIDGFSEKVVDFIMENERR